MEDRSAELTAWAQNLIAVHADHVPASVCNYIALLDADNEWNLIARSLVEWGVESRRLTAKEHAEALAFARAGMFSKPSPYYVELLEHYTPTAAA